MHRALPFILLALATPLAAETVHVVQQGENLSLIAARTLGGSHRAGEIARLNGLANPNHIRIGQRLRIPDGATAAPPATRTREGSSPPHSQATGPAPAAPESPEAQDLAVVDATGGLELMRAGEPVEIGGGARLRAGDALRTGPAGRVLLAGMNGERLELGASTTLYIREASSTLADRRLVLRIDAGSLRLQAPETPFLARYLIESPTGQVGLRSGDVFLEAAPPDRLAVCAWAGRVTVVLPRGSRDLVVGQGAVFQTAELPAAAGALPSVPGLSVETTARSLIAAAAGLPGQSVIFELFSDRDLQKRAAVRRVPTDNLGLATVRLEPGPGTWWLAVRAFDRNGLSSMPALPPPARIAER